MKTTLNVSTCEGRHEIPKAVDGGIFPMQIENPTDGDDMAAHVKRKFRELFKDCDMDKFARVNLYVTGYTPATLAIVMFCVRNRVPLTCWHYDAVKAEYWPQDIVNYYGEVI